MSMSLDETVDFAGWLLSEMHKRKLSQSDLARITGISRQAISSYVNRRILTPDKESLQKIAHAFGMRQEDIYRVAGILPPANGIPPDIARAVYQLEQLPEPLRSILTKMIDTQYNQWENDRTANLKPKTKPNSL